MPRSDQEGTIKPLGWSVVECSVLHLEDDVLTMDTGSLADASKKIDVSRVAEIRIKTLQVKDYWGSTEMGSRYRQPSPSLDRLTDFTSLRRITLFPLYLDRLNLATRVSPHIKDVLAMVTHLNVEPSPLNPEHRVTMAGMAAVFPNLRTIVLNNVMLLENSGAGPPRLEKLILIGELPSYHPDYLWRMHRCFRMTNLQAQFLHQIDSDSPTIPFDELIMHYITQTKDLDLTDDHLIELISANMPIVLDPEARVSVITDSGRPHKKEMIQAAAKIFGIEADSIEVIELPELVEID